MSLDVIIVNYESSDVLPRCLGAVEAFVGAPPRIIFVDNSPGDGSASVLGRYFPKSTIITNSTNVGFATAVNRGLAAATADIVMLLNPDVNGITGDYRMVEQLFEDEPELAAVGPRLLFPDGSLQRSCRTAPQLYDMVAECLALAKRFPRWKRPQEFQLTDWAYDSRRYVDCLSGALLFLRRTALEDVGLLDERFFMYYEETDWLVRAKERSWRALFTPEISATHAAGGSSGSPQSVLSAHFIASQIHYARKHYGRSYALVLRAVMASVEATRWAACATVKGRSLSRERGFGFRLRAYVRGTNRLPSPAE